MKKLILLLALSVLPVVAQETIDHSGAQAVWPFPVRTASPGACRTGQLFTRSDGTPGQNVYICGPDNTWTAVGASTGGATSVGLSMPSTFCVVTNSPVTAAGTLTCTYATGQPVNRVFGTDASGNVGSFALTAVMLPSIASTLLSDSASLVRTTDTATVTSAMLAGSIANSKLTNSSFTVAGHSVSLGGSQAIAASDLSNGVTGSGSVVLGTSPTLVTPALGTPTALVLTNATGLPHAALPALVSGDIPSNAANTSGNSATTTALASTPTLCAGGNYPLGIDVLGNAKNCTPIPVFPLPVDAVTGTAYTLVNGDSARLKTFSNASSVAVTLPQATTGGSLFSAVTNSAVNGVSVSSGVGTTGAVSITAGRLVLVVMEWNVTGPVASTMTSSAGDTCTLAGNGSVAAGSSSPHLASFYCANAVGGSTTFTTTWTSFAGLTSATSHVMQYTSMATSAVLDQVSSTTGTSGTPTSPTVTTTFANELIVGVFTTIGCTSTVGSGFTSRIASGTMMLGGLVEDSAVNSVSNYSVATASDSCGNWGAQILTFRTTATPTFVNGWWAHLQNKGAGTVTVTPATSTIGGASSLVLPKGYTALVTSDGINYQIVVHPNTLAAIAPATAAGQVGVPVQVGYAVATAQTANIAATTLFTTTAADAMFQASIVVDCTSTATGETLAPAIRYTDTSNTVQTITGTTAVCTSLTSGSVTNQVLAFQAKASTNIQYLVTTAVAATATWNVRASIEQLSTQ